MPSISITYEQAERNYPQETQEIMRLVQASRSNHRNMSGHDMNWEIMWTEHSTPETYLQLLVQGTLQSQNQAPARGFVLSASYQRLSKSIGLRGTPVEYLRFQEDMAHEDEMIEEMEDAINFILEESLEKANSHEEGKYLRVNDCERGIICAYPLLFGIKDSKGVISFIIDNYKANDNKKVVQLSGVLKFIQSDLVVDLEDLREAQSKNEKVKIGNKKYEIMSHQEIKKITDFFPYTGRIS